MPPPVTDPTRNFYTTSSCGVCGKASIDAVRTRSPLRRRRPTRSPCRARTLAELPDRLRAAQRTFDRTGGLHAAGLFTAGGELVVLREDVGRHNAVDKVIGWALREGRLPLTGHVLLVSGRASFELTQKAWMAGMPLLAAVSAPEHPRRRAGRGGRHDPGRLPARRDHERLHRAPPRHRLTAGGHLCVLFGHA